MNQYAEITLKKYWQGEVYLSPVKKDDADKFIMGAKIVTFLKQIDGKISEMILQEVNEDGGEFYLYRLDLATGEFEKIVPFDEIEIACDDIINFINDFDPTVSENAPLEEKIAVLKKMFELAEKYRQKN